MDRMIGWMLVAGTWARFCRVVSRGWLRGDVRGVALCLAATVILLACGTLTEVAPAPANADLSFYTLDAKNQLAAYRVRDGSLRWTYVDQGAFVSGTVATYYSNGMVFAFTFVGRDTSHFVLVAVRASDGKPAWHLRMAGQPPQIAFSGSDVVVRDQGDAQSSLLVVRAADGSQVSEFPVDAGRNDFALDGDMAFFCSPGDDLEAYRLSDGQLVWRTPATDLGAVPVGTPVVAPDGTPVAPNSFGCEPRVFNGTIFVTGVGYYQAPPFVRSAALYNVRERDGHILWTYRAPGWAPSAGLRGAEGGLNGAVFVLISSSARDAQQRVQDAVVALRESDGSELWHQFIDQGSDVLVDAGGAGITLVQGNDLHTVNAADGSPLWQYHDFFHYLYPEGATNGVVFAFSGSLQSTHNPAPSGADTADYLVALNARNGSLYWRLPFSRNAIATGEA